MEKGEEGLALYFQYILIINDFLQLLGVFVNKKIGRKVERRFDKSTAA